MQGQVEVLNRELFSSLIQKKITLVNPSIYDFTRAIENELKRKNFTQASITLREMKKFYPDSEEYYLSRLDYLASLGRGDDIKSLINEIYKRNIFLSSKTKEVLAFWEA
mgnify:FL=1